MSRVRVVDMDAGFSVKGGVCMCVCDTTRERERGRERDDDVCVCVCVCVCAAHTIDGVHPNEEGARLMATR